MGSNPYQSPKIDEPQAIARNASSPLAWWGKRQVLYNLALLVAGFFAFVCYAIVCLTLLPRVLPPSEIEVGFVTTVGQGIGYLFAMGLANVCYLAGPLSEYVVRPSNVARYRRVCYWSGFWLSVLLPFAIPSLLTVEVLFFPEWLHAKSSGQ